MPACAQVLQHADVAFFFGMIDTQQRIDAMTMQLLISQLIADGANTQNPNWWLCGFHLYPVAGAIHHI